jgi:hypothetical protein
MSIKEIYKNLLVNRYNNKKYYSNAIEFDYSNNVVRIASPNCSTRLILKPTFNEGNLVELTYALSGDMFAFVVTELIIDYLLTHNKEDSKAYLNKLVNKLNTETEVDAILTSNYQSSSINKILGYFNTFVNSYWL